MESAEPLPDGVFAFNDTLAIGALRALLHHGVGVPSTVAVIGIDDIEEAAYVTPSLTTIAPDKQAIARGAVEHLARRLDSGEAWTPEEVTVGYSLVVRESTAGGARHRCHPA